MFQTKIVEKTETYFISNNFPPPSQICAINEIMWKNIVEWERSEMKIRRMRIACWITKATNRHPEYVILIPFPLQQWLHEHASVLRYTYNACVSHNLG